MDAAKKAAQMKEKTELVRREFSLPESEEVVQDYSCSVTLLVGRLFLTYNYLCWKPGLAGNNILVPFRRIKSVKRDRGIILDTAVTIEVEDGTTYTFTSLVHRDETLNFVDYLKKNIPYYVEPPTQEEFEAVIEESLPPPSERPISGNYNGQLQKTKLVDTQSAKNALRIAQQTKELGVNTLQELAKQGEQLDRIGRNIESIHSNLDYANTLLRGIESIGGYFFNSLKGRDKGPIPPDVVEEEIKKLEWKRKEEAIDYEILEKHKDDSVTQTTLRFVEDKFMILDADSKKPRKDAIWSIDRIASLVVRARPLHLDIRFKDPKLVRFRLASNFVQGIVMDFYVRNKEISVEFEPGTRQFEFMGVPVGKPGEAAEKSGKTRGLPGGVFRRSKKVSEMMNKNADPQIKADLDEQDDLVEQIGDTVLDLHGIATTMGHEVDRQNKQLDHLNKRADDVNAKFIRTNKRLDKNINS